MKKEAIFHRQDLAKRLADDLVSEDGASGLFVAALRRTGKSTFIREDLIPILKSVHGAEVVCADLWEDSNLASITWPSIPSRPSTPIKSGSRRLRDRRQPAYRLAQ